MCVSASVGTAWYVEPLGHQHTLWPYVRTYPTPDVSPTPPKTLPQAYRCGSVCCVLWAWVNIGAALGPGPRSAHLHKQASCPNEQPKKWPSARCRWILERKWPEEHADWKECAWHWHGAWFTGATGADTCPLNASPVRSVQSCTIVLT